MHRWAWVVCRAWISRSRADVSFEQLRAAGAEVAQEPIEQPYGVRDCAVRGVSGNMLCF